MQKSINMTIKTAVAILAIVLCAGCNTDKMEPAVSVKGAVVELSVSAGDMKTKAIDETAIKSVRIFAFDNAGELVGHIYKNSPASGEKFHMALSVPGDQPTVTVDFYAVANESAMYAGSGSVSLSENMTIDELKGIVYSSLITTYEAMPLYGVLEDQTLTLSSDLHVDGNHTALKIQETVAVNLERSLAKIGVYAAALEGTTITPIVESITFIAAGRRDVSYLFPAEDAAALRTRDAGVTSLNRDRIFDLAADQTDMLSNGGVVTKKLAAQNTDPDSNVTDHYTEILSPFYLAEVPYGTDDWTVAADPSGRPVSLVIKYQLNEEDIDRYATVNMPAIERNTFYQVRCLIKSDGQILVKVSVNPWEEGEAWDLSFDFPTHSDPLLATGTYDPDTGKYSDHVYGTEATAYFTGTESDPKEGGAFSVDFNMSYPIGGIWMPSISGASNDDFEVRLYERGSLTELTDHYVAVTDSSKDKWYTIKVVPLKSSNIGSKVTLSVSYTPVYVGADYSYLLQINGGEENDLAWAEKDPQTGDEFEASTVDIVITQVDTPLGGI